MLRSRPRPAQKMPNHFLLWARIANCFYPEWSPLHEINQSLLCCFFSECKPQPPRDGTASCHCHVFQNEWPPRDGTIHGQSNSGAKERYNRKSSPVRTFDRLSSTFGEVEPKVNQVESFEGQNNVPECDQEQVLHTKWLWKTPFFTERKIEGKTNGSTTIGWKKKHIPSTDEHTKCEKSHSPGVKNARPFHAPIETSPGAKNAQPFSAPIENRQLLLPGMKPSA